ncbi:MAG: inositol monophosphatase [Bacillaceae bacterium]|uniref:Inositol-1-monophosphatase n=1 Tax=Alkalihalobacterium chitinilyticum TaxID=2980103 RepID=A0ABT5VH76_9BACI|nr:inositol monophosphatase family protein [Alkalihalobacterium chitinilyticum]MDE5414630.1 inositol monophosphatase [Alkalihalobacterium chitinilyticum]MEB1807121.1 inositol monophosphatase [Bacillaceae bacterium]
MEQWLAIKENIKTWVREVGKEQLIRMEQPFQMKSKSSDIDLVTEVDEWSEQFLIDKIHTEYPEHSIMSEESGWHEGQADYEWVIDPIDGTVNFAHRFPFFCISIGVKYKGETVIGVVYVPKLDEMYEAVKGSGATLNGRSITVSVTERLNQAVVATGFPYDRATDPDNNVGNFNAIITKIGGIRRTGSAAIDLCQVAAGRFDAYWEIKLKEWDISAGLLIVEEAKGQTFSVKKEKGYQVLVGTPAIYDELSAILEWEK